MAKEKDERLRWYAARIVKDRQFVLKVVEQNHLSTYTARILPNILFVCATTHYVRSMALECAGKAFFYRNPERSDAQPIDEKQMRNFMLVSSAPEDCLISLGDVDKSFLEGQRVRVTGGIFEGAEGVVKRIKGDRRLIVSLSGVACIATSFIPPSLLEKVEE